MTATKIKQAIAWVVIFAVATLIGYVLRGGPL